MSQPFAIRCCSCHSIWEAESLSTLIQCPDCLAMLELVGANGAAPVIDQEQSHELRWLLARVMVLQAISRWRQRLHAEQPQLVDLPYEPRPAWWTDPRMLWRGVAIAGVLGLCYFLAPWQLTLALTVAIAYALIVHPGWNRDERARQVVALRTQTMPLLMDVPRSEFARGGRYDGVPFDAMAWLQAVWAEQRSGDIYQILGWQEKLLAEINTANLSAAQQTAVLSYLHETKALSAQAH